MRQEQRLAEEKLLKQREEWELQVREMNDKMREKEDEIKSQMQTDGDLDKRRLAEQLAHQESKLAEELVKAEILFEKKQQELMEKQRELESSLQKQMREAKQLSQQKDRERIERIRFDDALLQSIPLINEANSIGDELQRQTLFALKLVTCWPPVSMLSKPGLSLEDDECTIAESISADLKVQVKFQESGTFRSVMLDAEQFHANIYIMREMYQVFIENNRTLSAVAAWNDVQDPDCDPFYDPPQPQLIGKSYVFLNSIDFGCKISETVPIFDHRGLTNGTLKCEITPTILSHEWQALQHKLVENCSEEFSTLELPTLADFMGSNLRVNIFVDRLQGIPGKLCKDVFVVIKWSDDGNGGEEEHTSPPAASPTVNPLIDFSVLIERTITPDLVSYAKDFPLELSVYGIVPSSNLNSIASQVIDLTNSKSSRSVADELDDPGNSVVFYDVDESGKNKILSKRKSMRRRRNGKVLSGEEDAGTLLEQCHEQLAVQGRILAENTQELENKANEVVHLQHRVASEKAEKERLRDALESLARTNKLLQAKLEQQILKQSVVKFVPDRKKTAVSVDASKFGNTTQSDHLPTHGNSDVGQPDRQRKDDVDALVERAIFEEAEESSLVDGQFNSLPTAKETAVPSREEAATRTSKDSKNDFGSPEQRPVQNEQTQAHPVLDTEPVHGKEHADQGGTAQLTAKVTVTPAAEQQQQPTTELIATSTRAKPKGLFHAVFSMQHKNKKHGCPVS